jgi:hypothetical protein
VFATMSWLGCFKLKWNHLYVFDFAFDGGTVF